MQIIKGKEVEGYEYKDIVEELRVTYGDYAVKRFKDWFNGQTGFIQDGKFCVYKWDYDRFINSEL